MTTNQVFGKTGHGVQSHWSPVNGPYDFWVIFNHIRENSAPSKFRFDLMI